MREDAAPRSHPWIGWVLLIVIALGGVIGWVAVRSAGAKSDLEQAARSATSLQQALVAGDVRRAENLATRIAGHTSSARDLSSDPVWRAFELLPWVGDDLTELRGLAEAADVMASEALPEVIAAARIVPLGTLGFREGATDPAALRAAQPALTRAMQHAAEAEALLAELDVDAEGAGETVAALRGAIETISALRTASELIPAMLDAQERRTILLVVQNSAEVRSSGGRVRALIPLRAEGGALTIGRVTDPAVLDAPGTLLEIGDATGDLFGEEAGLSFADATMALEFPEAAALIRERWMAANSGEVDAVIAVDSVVLARLLGATGSMTLAGYTLAANNALEVLSTDIYRDSPRAHEAFNDAAAAVLKRVLDATEPARLITALTAAGGHIRVWSAHPEEQARLAAAGLDGALGDAGIGVFVNDVTGGTLDAYTRADISVASAVCRDETVTRVRVTWTNTLAPGGEPLPELVTGPLDEEREPGVVRTLIAIAGPSGARALGADAGRTRLGDREVILVEIEVAPGDSQIVSVDFAGGLAPGLDVRHTPLLRDPAISAGALECGG